MTAIEEMIVSLQKQIAEAEAKAFEDMDRIDLESEQRQKDRWRCMKEETSDLRKSLDYFTREAANVLIAGNLIIPIEALETPPSPPKEGE